MKLLNRLERKFGDLAIPNLTMYLIALQGFSFFITLTYHGFTSKLELSHDRLMAGEWWRLLTLILMPPGTYPAFIILFLYFYFLIGTTLENFWGTFRYNLYILIAYLATILVALIPGAHVTNFFMMESILLAFAWLNPEYEVLLLFVLPVKVKWLGLAGWIWYLYAFFMGGWDTKAEVAAGAINFLIFFADDLWQWARTSKRKLKSQMARANDPEPNAPLHVCALCGINDQTDRKMEFRYCPQCSGTPAYCINHIHAHEHR